MFETDEEIEMYFNIVLKNLDKVNWEKIQVPLVLPMLEDRNRQLRELYADRKFRESLFKDL